MLTGKFFLVLERTRLFLEIPPSFEITTKFFAAIFDGPLPVQTGSRAGSHPPIAGCDFFATAHTPHDLVLDL